MAVLIGGGFVMGFCVVGAFLTEVVIPKITRNDCNDSVSPLWIDR